MGEIHVGREREGVPWVCEYRRCAEGELGGEQESWTLTFDVDLGMWCEVMMEERGG